MVVPMPMGGGHDELFAILYPLAFIIGWGLAFIAAWWD